MRRKWEHTRMISFWIYRVNSTDRNITPEKFMPLGDDVKEITKAAETTPEERQQLSEMAIQRAALFGDKIK